MDDEGISSTEIPDGPKLAYVTPSHQFPTGAVMSPRGDWSCSTGPSAGRDLSKTITTASSGTKADLWLRCRGSMRRTRGLHGHAFEGASAALRLGYMVAPGASSRPFWGRIGSPTATWRCSTRLCSRCSSMRGISNAISAECEKSTNAGERRCLRLRDALWLAVRVCWGRRAACTCLCRSRAYATHASLWTGARTKRGIYSAHAYYSREPPRGATFLMGYSSVGEDGIREGVRRLAEIAAD